MAKITKRFVDGLKPDSAAREVFYWDDALPGFGIRVKPSGTGSYVIQYRNNDGRTRRLKLAALGHLTPDEARYEARAKLTAVAKGADPAEEKRQKRMASTIEELCNQYLAERGPTKKASTLDSDRRRIERHIKPLLGRYKVPSVTRSDIERFMLDVANGKTARDEKTGWRGRTKTRGGKEPQPGQWGFYQASSNSLWSAACVLITQPAASSDFRIRRGSASCRLPKWHGLGRPFARWSQKALIGMHLVLFDC